MVSQERTKLSWYEEIRANFAFHFNKAVPFETNLCKLEKTFVTSSLLDAKTNMWMWISLLVWRGTFFDRAENL